MIFFNKDDASITKTRSGWLSLISFLAIVFWGCGNNGNSDLGRKVVQVYEHTLYTTDLESKMPLGYTKEDSARIASQIVNNWVREKVLLHVAEQNLSDAQKSVERQLDEYRNSLIVYAYERALIGQKLDTLVSEEELQAYYNDNSGTFKLKSYIAKMRFVKVASEAPLQVKLKNWMLSDDEEDLENLYDYCRKYADNFFLEEDKWLYIEDIMKEVPLPTDDMSTFLKSGSNHVFESNNFTYYVRFFDYRLKDDTAPLALERSRIKNLILNKRKASLIVQMRDDVVSEAHENGNIQLFEK